MVRLKKSRSKFCSLQDPEALSNINQFSFIIKKHLLQVKFRFSEKVTKIWKNLTLVLTILSKRQNRREIFSNFVAFSQYLNFTYILFTQGFRRLHKTGYFILNLASQLSISQFYCKAFITCDTAFYFAKSRQDICFKYHI